MPSNKGVFAHTKHYSLYNEHFHLGKSNFTHITYRTQRNSERVARPKDSRETIMFVSWKAPSGESSKFRMACNWWKNPAGAELKG